MSARELHGDELSPNEYSEHVGYGGYGTASERRAATSAASARPRDTGPTQAIDPTDAAQGPARSTTTAEHLVLAALENPQHRWRTLEDLCRDTGLDGLTVYRVLHRHEEVVQSSRLTVDGDELFTTWQHYRKHSTFLERLGAAFRSRAA